MDPKLRILIVDDDRRMAHTLADILNLEGFKVVEVFSGQAALEEAHSQTFDCVLTDVKMPGMNGVELHRQLRQAQPGLPVILMTAYADYETLHLGMEEGVVGVYEKPLDINQLLGFFTSLSKNRTIAIVDDDPVFCKTMGEILQQRGFKVALITDPHTDMEQMAFNAQVILLDLKLNSVSGLDVLKEIRARYPTLPVLMVTGYRQELDAAIKAGMEISAFTCLYKPLEIPALLEMLAKIQLDRLRGAFTGS